MNLFRKIVLLVLILTCGTAYAGFNVNFSDMDLTDFVGFVSEFTKKNIVYDKGILKGKVSIDSATQIRSSDILDIFSSTLKANGFDVLDRGKYLEIVRNNDYSDDDDSTGTGAENALVTTVIYPKNFDATILTNAIQKLKSKGGYAEVLKGVNAIVMRDKVGKIIKIKNFIDKLDTKAQSYTFRVIKIDNASAANVADKLTKLYGDMVKQNIVASAPVIASDDYSNMLMIASEEKDFERIQYLIKQLDSKNSNNSNMPKVYYLKNANAEDVSKVLTTLTSDITTTTQGDKKTDQVKASVTFDKATNSIVVFGNTDLYSKMEAMIKKLDVPRRQVYVEALILETTLDSGNKFGVEWETTLGGHSGVGTIGYINDSSSGLTSFVSSAMDGKTPGLSSGFNLGVLGNVIKYNGASFPTLGALANFIKTASSINILSNPQILTLDNEEAQVFVGENRPFVTSTKYDSNGNPISTYEYNDVGVKLVITPQITSDDTVTLKIEQEVKKVSENAVISSSSSSTSSAPVTLTRSTKTRIRLKDGTMVVISGLLKDDEDKTNSAVPWLSDIPVIGWLFKTKSTTAEKTNMMVFISAHIINTQEDADRITDQKHQESMDFNKQIDDKIRNEFK